MAGEYYGESEKMNQAIDARVASVGIGPGPGTTVAQRLHMQIREHQYRINECKKLLELLERNPDVDAILNLTRSLL